MTEQTETNTPGRPIGLDANGPGYRVVEWERTDSGTYRLVRRLRVPVRAVSFPTRAAANDYARTVPGSTIQMPFLPSPVKR